MIQLHRLFWRDVKTANHTEAVSLNKCRNKKRSHNNPGWN